MRSPTSTLQVSVYPSTPPPLHSEESAFVPLMYSVKAGLLITASNHTDSSFSTHSCLSLLHKTLLSPESESSGHSSLVLIPFNSTNPQTPHSHNSQNTHRQYSLPPLHNSLSQMNSNLHSSHHPPSHSSASCNHSPQTHHPHFCTNTSFQTPPSPDSQTQPASSSSRTADNHSPTPTPSTAKNSHSDSILRHRDRCTHHSSHESLQSQYPFHPNPHRSSQSVCVHYSSVPLHQTSVRFASSPPRSLKPHHFHSLPPSPHSQFDLPTEEATTTCHPSQSSPQSPSQTGANPQNSHPHSPSTTPPPNYAYSRPLPNNT